MYSRYAIYVVPDGAWGDIGAAWLGWDSRSGDDIKQPTQAQIDLTDRPRKYGFHGTIKPPFRLAEGQNRIELADAARQLCAGFKPFALPSLQLSQLGKFFALTAPGDHDALRRVADTMVEKLEPFRAPLTPEDLARRRTARLSDAQDALLVKWGYPYVFDEFRFHLTLSGPQSDPAAVQALFDPIRERLADTPLTIDSLCLLGEADTGRFHVLERFAFDG